VSQTRGAETIRGQWQAKSWGSLIQPSRSIELSGVFQILERASTLQPTHPIIQTMREFFAFRARMRAEDPKDINPWNFDNSSNVNWQGVFLFIVYTSVVLGFFLVSRTGKCGSGDGPAPILPLKSPFQFLPN
jgi:hypothetical protein